MQTKLRDIQSNICTFFAVLSQILYFYTDKKGNYMGFAQTNSKQHKAQQTKAEQFICLMMLIIYHVFLFSIKIQKNKKVLYELTSLFFAGIVNIKSSRNLIAK
jgi:hypothetical protein